MATSVDLGGVLDRAYEDKTLQEIFNAPPSALAGLTERHNQVVSEVSASRPSPNWATTSTSLWPESSSQSPEALVP
jgi:hypothetical protein